jgi:prophage antirepressor-like protein
MTIVIEQFNTEIFTLNVYGTYDEPLFKVMEVAKVLQYNNIRQTISNLPDEFKRKLTVSYCQTFYNDGKVYPAQNRQICFITEGGLYYMAMRSNLPIAKDFQVWVCNTVLPSLRKKGYYEIENKLVSKKLTFEIKTELDLHTKVVEFVRSTYPHALFTASLGELQDTSDKRIMAYKSGYTKGEVDILINNLHKKYSGFAIEIKSPTGQGRLNKYQSDRLKKYQQNNYMTLVSNDYDNIIYQIIHYMDNVRIKCQYCSGKFVSQNSLKNHQKYIHRIKP